MHLSAWCVRVWVGGPRSVCRPWCMCVCAHVCLGVCVGGTHSMSPMVCARVSVCGAGGSQRLSPLVLSLPLILCSGGCWPCGPPAPGPPQDGDLTLPCSTEHMSWGSQLRKMRSAAGDRALLCPQAEVAAVLVQLEPRGCGSEPRGPAQALSGWRTAGRGALGASLQPLGGHFEMEPGVHEGAAEPRPAAGVPPALPCPEWNAPAAAGAHRPAPLPPALISVCWRRAAGIQLLGCHSDPRPRALG